MNRRKRAAYSSGLLHETSPRHRSFDRQASKLLRHVNLVRMSMMPKYIKLGS